MIKLNIELTGNEEDVLSFVGLCAKIQLLSMWGSSRIIPVSIDGDGSCDLKFNIITEVKDKGEVDLIKEWKYIHKDTFYKEIDKEKLETHYIGE